MNCGTTLMKIISILIFIIISVKAHWPHDTVDGLAVSDDGQEIYACVRDTLLHSKDGGATWDYLRSLTDLGGRWYLALSPYADRYLYVRDSDGVIVRSNDLIHWDELAIQSCAREYYHKYRRRTTFPISGALIAGEGILYKEDSNAISGFAEILDPDNNFGNCPSLSAVRDSDIVYAGATTGLMRSDDGGVTWSMVVAMADIVEVRASEGNIFVMTTTGICRVDEAAQTCTDIGLPETTEAEKVRTGPSPPTDLSYSGGTLIVTRANSVAVYRTTDFGANWMTSNEQEGDFPEPGHGGKNAWDFEGGEEFTHVEGSYVGSWIGLFRTDDIGNSWLYRDTIRRAVTAFGLLKSKAGDFTVVACTYAAGCHFGPPSNLVHRPFGKDFYNALHLSPNYDEDGIGFENTRIALHRLDGSLVDLPLIEAGVRISLKTVVFSPTFEVDSTMFVTGYNLGVLESKDNGATFTRIFDGAGTEVTRLVLSPNFGADGVMACLVDPDYKGNSARELGDTYIYVSNDAGSTWSKMVFAKLPWRDLIIVDGDPDPIIVAIKGDTRKLFAHSSVPGGSFKYIQGSANVNIRPQGSGFDGLAVSPDGKTFASAWVEGGIIFGEVSLYSLDNKRYSSPNPFGKKAMETLPEVFGRLPPSVASGFGRMFTSHIVFSPDYANDNTIFAASMFDIYQSTNQGTDWTKVFAF